MGEIEINNKLKELYSSKMVDLKSPLLEYNNNHKDKATNPLLIKVNEEWEKADYKIMIIGQETNGWCHECGENQNFTPNIDKSLEVYGEFYLNKIGYKSPFWNEFRRIKRGLSSDKKIEFCWNNVIKIGRVGVGNSPKINKIKEEFFNVLLNEIEILKPNIIILFTGPKYDCHVEKYIGKNKTIPISNFSINELSKVEFENLNLKLCLKTYHPNYLYRSGLRAKVINEIIKILNTL